MKNWKKILLSLNVFWVPILLFCAFERIEDVSEAAQNFKYAGPDIGVEIVDARLEELKCQN